MRTLLIRVAAAAIAVTAASAPSPVSAQEVGALPMPAVEVSGGYVYMRDLSDDFTEKLNFPAGWYAAAAVNLNRWFGVVGEASGSYKSDFSSTYETLTFTDSARVHTFMAGPRFAAKSGRLVPYAQFLVGAAHFRTSTMYTEAGFSTPRFVYTDTQFALQPGGGLNVLVTEHLGVRVGADFRTIMDFVEGEDPEFTNEFRVLTGFTFNWGAR